MVTAPTWNMGTPQPQRDPIQTKFRVCSSSTASFGSFGASDAAPHGPTGKSYELPFREDPTITTLHRSKQPENMT